MLFAWKGGLHWLKLQIDKNMAMGYFDKIEEVLAASCPVFMLHTHEFERAYAGLKSWCKEADAVLYKWNCVEGMLEMSLSFDSVMTVDERVSDVTQVLVEAERRQDSSEPEVFVLEGIVDFIHRADVKALLRKLSVDLPKSGGRKRVVLLSQIAELPTELCMTIPVLSMPLPDESELNKVLETELRALGHTVATELRSEILQSALGLSLNSASLVFRIAGNRTNFSDEAPGVIRECKQYFIEGTN